MSTWIVARRHARMNENVEKREGLSKKRAKVAIKASIVVVMQQSMQPVIFSVVFQRHGGMVLPGPSEVGVKPQV